MDTKKKVYERFTNEIFVNIYGSHSQLKDNIINNRFYNKKKEITLLR